MEQFRNALMQLNYEAKQAFIDAEKAREEDEAEMVVKRLLRQMAEDVQVEDSTT